MRIWCGKCWNTFTTAAEFIEHLEAEAAWWSELPDEDPEVEIEEEGAPA